jgi:hypothetical protein
VAQVVNAISVGEGVGINICTISFLSILTALHAAAFVVVVVVVAVVGVDVV